MLTLCTYVSGTLQDWLMCTYKLTNYTTQNGEFLSIIIDNEVADNRTFGLRRPPSVVKHTVNTTWILPWIKNPVHLNHDLWTNCPVEPWPWAVELNHDQCVHACVTRKCSCPVCVLCVCWNGWLGIRVHLAPSSLFSTLLPITCACGIVAHFTIVTRQLSSWYVEQINQLITSYSTKCLIPHD